FLRSRDRSLVVKHLGGADVPLARAPRFDAEFATFGLTADAESVVRLIDGRASAEEIAREAPAEAFAVEKLLAALVTLGLVHPEFAGEASSSAARAALAALPAPEAEPPSAEPSAEPAIDERAAAMEEEEEQEEEEEEEEEEEIEPEEAGAS